jgi:broad specificity phosphatase PhoE
VRVYLVRHGDEYHGDTEVHGHMDVPLTAKGFEQSKDLVARLMTEGIKRIYSSDLTRAIQTALPLSKAVGLGINSDERLRPIKLGDYEGKNFQDVEPELKRWEDAWLVDPKQAIPGGDSFHSFQARNISFFKDIAEHCENDEPVAVFTHSRNCHLMQHLAANDFRPLEHGTEDLLHHCDHQLGEYRTYQIDRTSNLARLANAGGQRGKSYSMRFIEPGLVRYEDVGDVLVQKPALDDMAQSFVGCPVFDRTHKDTSARDFSAGKADGIVTRVWTDPTDGWHWCEALIWDLDTQQHMRDGYGLSCAYDVLQWTNEQGTWHNIPYENEVKKGRYTHLAIVKKPRYEDVRIIANQGGNNMKLMFWKKDQKPEEKPSEVELVNAVVPLDGKDTPLEKVLEMAGAELKRQEELANAKKEIADDELVEVAGKRITFAEAKKLAATALRNEAENSMSADHKDGKHKDKKMESCTYCSNELANARAEQEAADRAAQAAADKAAKAEADKKAEELRNAARGKGDVPKMPALPSDRSDRLKAGISQYGPLAEASSTN